MENEITAHDVNDAIHIYLKSLLPEIEKCQDDRTHKNDGDMNSFFKRIFEPLQGTHIEDCNTQYNPCSVFANAYNGPLRLVFSEIDISILNIDSNKQSSNTFVSSLVNSVNNWAPWYDENNDESPYTLYAASYKALRLWNTAPSSYKDVDDVNNWDEKDEFIQKPFWAYPPSVLLFVIMNHIIKYNPDVIPSAASKVDRLVGFFNNVWPKVTKENLGDHMKVSKIHLYRAMLVGAYVDLRNKENYKPNKYVYPGTLLWSGLYQLLPYRQEDYENKYAYPLKTIESKSAIMDEEEWVEQIRVMCTTVAGDEESTCERIGNDMDLLVDEYIRFLRFNHSFIKLVVAQYNMCAHKLIAPTDELVRSRVQSALAEKPRRFDIIDRIIVEYINAFHAIQGGNITTNIQEFAINVAKKTKAMIRSDNPSEIYQQLQAVYADTVECRTDKQEIDLLISNQLHSILRNPKKISLAAFDYLRLNLNKDFQIYKQDKEYQDVDDLLSTFVQEYVDKMATMVVNDSDGKVNREMAFTLQWLQQMKQGELQLTSPNSAHKTDINVKALVTHEAHGEHKESEEDVSGALGRAFHEESMVGGTHVSCGSNISESDQNQITMLQQQKNNILAKLSEKTSKLEAATDEVTTLKQTLAAIESGGDVNVLTTRINEIQAKLTQSTTDKQYLNTELLKLQAARRTSQEAHDALAIVNSKLKTNVAQLETTLAQVKDQKTTLKETYNQMQEQAQNRVNNLEQQLVNVNTRLDQRTLELTQLYTNINNGNVDTAIQNTIQSQQHRIAELITIQNTLVQKERDLQKELIKAHNYVRELDAAGVELTARNDALKLSKQQIVRDFKLIKDSQSTRIQQLENEIVNIQVSAGPNASNTELVITFKDMLATLASGVVDTQWKPLFEQAIQRCFNVQNNPTIAQMKTCVSNIMATSSNSAQNIANNPNVSKQTAWKDTLANNVLQSQADQERLSTLQSHLAACNDESVTCTAEDVASWSSEVIQLMWSTISDLQAAQATDTETLTTSVLPGVQARLKNLEAQMRFQTTSPTLNAIGTAVNKSYVRKLVKDVRNGKPVKADKKSYTDLLFNAINDLPVEVVEKMSDTQLMEAQELQRCRTRRLWISDKPQRDIEHVIEKRGNSYFVERVVDCDPRIARKYMRIGRGENVVDVML